MSGERPTLWTIGTGHRSLDELTELLGAAAVEAVIDVRSYPRSHLRHFCRQALEESLPAAGLAYQWLGNDLGGLRKEGYESYMTSPRFASGLARLEALATAQPSALVCAEIDPYRCHRRLIANALTESSPWRVMHILRPGVVRLHVVEPEQSGLPFP